MFPTKATVLFLVVFTTFSINPVIGVPDCSNYTKSRLLILCQCYITKGDLVQLPPYQGYCCMAVRRLQRKDSQMIQCLAGLLDSEDKKKYDATKVRHLSVSCK
ncbi:hypothetical protein HU200_016680 [Digitaria exilis]|uniref:Bifunctional inhibitor/plant lipid transfer protein/seed storage helical domain-containing protein n=1 Tax=Digitaria exilis TaxID=1010633 RepID=A0A835F7J9_9POAL|nr:hypothetical protein HU200_016680 [Digitaria exilis]